MIKVKITAVIILVILALFISAMFLIKKYSNSSSSDINNYETPVAQNSQPALNLGEGVECTQVFQDNTGRSESKIYFYKNKARYDIKVFNGEKIVQEMHAISDGEYSYIWGTMFNIPGIEEVAMKVSTNGGGSAFMPQDLQNIEYLKSHNFKAPGIECKPWKPDLAVFNVPQDKKFMTEEEMMGAMVGASANPKAGPNMSNAESSSPGSFSPVNISCSICKEIPDEEAKKQCEDACQR